MIELLNIFHKLKMLSFANTFYFVNVKKFLKLLFRTTKKTMQAIVSRCGLGRRNKYTIILC